MSQQDMELSRCTQALIAKGSEQDTELSRCTQALIAMGFSASSWTRPFLNNRNIHVKSFVSTVENLIEIGDPFVLERVLKYAIEKGKWTAKAECTVEALLKYCSWLGNDEGKSFIARLKVYRMLQNKIMGNQSIEEVGWAYALDVQIELFKVRKKDIKMKTVGAEERSLALYELYKKMEPGTKFKEPKVFDLSSKCVAMEETLSGNVRETKTDEYLEGCTTQYKKDVIFQEKIKFMKTDGAFELSQGENNDQFNNFYALMETLSVDIPPHFRILRKLVNRSWTTIEETEDQTEDETGEEMEVETEDETEEETEDDIEEETEEKEARGWPRLTPLLDIPFHLWHLDF